MDFEQSPGRWNVCSWTGTYVDVPAEFPKDALPKSDGTIFTPWLKAQAPGCDRYGQLAIKWEVIRYSAMVRSDEGVSNRQARNIRRTMPGMISVQSIVICTAAQSLHAHIDEKGLRAPGGGRKKGK